MSMNQSKNETTFRVSQITPEELQAFLQEARRQRSIAFVKLLTSAARLVARPFRRGNAEGAGYLPHAR